MITHNFYVVYVQEHGANVKVGAFSATIVVNVYEALRIHVSRCVLKLHSLESTLQLTFYDGEEESGDDVSGRSACLQCYSVCM